MADFVITNELAVAPTQNAMKLSHFWVAALNELRLTTADLLTADGTISSAGRSLQFRSALRLQRESFISTAFRAAHSNLANLIESIISTAQHGCFWGLLADEATYVTARRTSKTITMALVCKAEQTLAPFAGQRHVCTAKEFFEFVIDIDSSTLCVRVHNM